MPGINLTKICNTVMRFFNETVNKLDESIKFVKRTSKINTKLFVDILITGCLSDTMVSLEGMCKLAKERGVKITKQALHQRFNPEAIALMHHLFQESLKQYKTENHDVIDLLKPFSLVQMVDSTGVSLPSKLKNLFKGCGGSGSEAGLKLQVLWDYLKGQVKEVTITEGCKNDVSFSGHLNQIEQRGLYLQDLGYFKLDTFATIQAKNAYFISRYLNQTKIFNEMSEPINLLQELRKAGTSFVKNVLLDRRKKKLAVRLIAFHLSDLETEERIRKLKRNAQKNGRIPKEETLELACWSIYITNVPKQMLNDEQVHLVYSLRWQIELFFKLCKGEAGIDKVGGKNPDRILCEIYAKLICIVISLYFCFPLRWKANLEISFQKAYRILRLKAANFFKALQSRYRLIEFLKLLFDDLNDFAFKDKKRKKRRLAYQKIMDSTGQEVLA